MASRKKSFSLVKELRESLLENYLPFWDDFIEAHNKEDFMLTDFQKRWAVHLCVTTKEKKKSSKSHQIIDWKVCDTKYKEIGHILRHGMATLARKVGGGLDAVIAMTGHKDFKLADHYSKLDREFQKEISEKIMLEVREKQRPQHDYDNVISLFQIASGDTK